jgi:hypothetical protein
MNYIFNNKIKSEQDLIQLLTALLSEDRLYHCEDNANDLVGDIFTKEEGDALNERMNEAYKLDWSQCDFATPCALAIHVINR